MPKGIVMPVKRSVQDLLEEEIKDLYSAEKQLIRAIPKMAKGATDKSLQSALLAHLKETEEQVRRLEEAAQILDFRPSGKKCIGMQGCIEEGSEALEADGDETVLDLGIVGAGTRVEHYEMAGYMTAIGLAQSIGNREVVALLKASLAEEEGADQKLRKIGSTLLKHAPSEQLASIIG